MVRTEDAEPLDLFNQGIRAEATRYRYTMTLRQVLCGFLGDDMLTGTFEERVKQLVQYGRDDPKWVRDLFLILTRKMQERTRLARDDPDYLNPTSIPCYFKPIKKLFDMNDVSINWKRVYATFPERDNVSGSAGWTRREIAVMLKHARDTQDRALILVLSSSGVRAGALDALDWGDLTPVYRADGKLVLDPGEGGEVACAMLEIYRGSVENYTTFITPEAFEALQDYGRAWAEAMGRQAKAGDPIFVRAIGMPARTTRMAIQKRLNRVARRSGLRGDLKDDRRHRVPLMNGFRRFWNKTCKDILSGDTLGALIRAEYMMGHRGLTSLDQNYFKTTPLELAAAYMQAVPDLTIDDADRLRLTNKRLRENIQKADGEKDEVLAGMKEEMARLKEEAERREAEAAAREREKDEKMARLEVEAARREEEMARMKRENEEAAERSKRESSEDVALLREEVAELKQRSGASIPDVLAALRESDETEGISKTVVDSLTGTFQLLAKAQEAAQKEMRDYYDAKMAGMARTMEWMAEKAGIKYDPRAEFGKDEPPETDPRHHDPRDSGPC